MKKTLPICLISLAGTLSLLTLIGPASAAADDAVHYIGTVTVTEQLDETHPADPTFGVAAYHDVQSYSGSVTVDYPESGGSFGTPTFSNPVISGSYTRTSSDSCIAFSESYSLDGTRATSAVTGQKPSMTLKFPTTVSRSGGCDGDSSTSQSTATFACPSTSVAGSGNIVFNYDQTLSPGGGITGQVRYTCKGTLTSDSGDTIVNSTADRGLKSGATSCDTDQTVGSAAECTLRAAIELANQGGPSHINFAIPDTVNPVISPASKLPTATATVNIDGTTQGSWVVLSGANAGAVDGLEIDGAASEVRGLVVNGFSSGAGIVAGGSGGVQVIAGNRIGTDVTGRTAVPNKVGVLLKAPEVRVGGIVGTSAGNCSGDCNLLAGNSDVQLGNYDYKSSSDPPAAVAANVEGNWIGVDATGNARLSAPGTPDGIVFNASGSGGANPSFPVGQKLKIGGPSARPGLAPGNLIAAQGRGVVVSIPADNPAAKGSVSVAGNLVGLNRSGAAAVGGGDTGIIVADAVTAAVVGGPEASTNVVGGWKTGIELDDGATLDHTKVGTDLTGMSAVRNEVGVHISGGGEIDHGLISGNGIGVSGIAIVLGQGDEIGLAADGKSALPNDVGVGSQGTTTSMTVEVGRSSTADAPCVVSPCAVISGNRVAGIRIEDDGYPKLNLAGAYIGTSDSGRDAVPNGTGISVKARDFQLAIGQTATQHAALDPSLVDGDACVYPCNVISGNAGPGLSLTATGSSEPLAKPSSVKGNLFGLASADGEKLPNQGPDIAITGADTANPLTIGGDDSRYDGNILASAGSPAVSIEGSEQYPQARIAGNRFETSGPAAAIWRTAASVGPPYLDRVDVAGKQVTVTGSTRVTADPVEAAEKVELYAGTGCRTGTRVPVGTVTAAKLSGKFSIKLPLSAFDGKPVVTALRTSQTGSTSAFSSCLSVKDPSVGSPSVKATMVTVPVNCPPGPACSIILQLSVSSGQWASSGTRSLGSRDFASGNTSHRSKGKKAKQAKRIILGRTKVKLKAHSRKKVRVKLNRKGKRRLVKRHRLKVRLTVSIRRAGKAQTLKSRSVTFHKS